MTATAMMRRQAREWAVQMLAAADLNPPPGGTPEDLAAFMQGFWRQVSDLDDEDGGPQAPCAKARAFAETRVGGVLSGRAEVDGILSSLLVGWELPRLGTVERAVLRLGVWEMKETDVPKPVVINECIDLANWFSSPKTRAIVNGVLDRYAKSLA